MPDFQLFRIKILLPTQQDFFQEEIDRAKILRDIIEQKPHPSAELRKGITWHIGNVEKVGKHALYFRFGRTGTSKHPILEKEDFADVVIPKGPHTHVVVELDTEACGIAKSSSLNLRPPSIANRLAELLNEQEIIKEKKLTVQVNVVPDPHDFIEHIRTAKKVTRFWFTFTRPNPPDVKSFVIKPLEQYAQKVGAELGKTEIEGEDLERGTIAEIARTSASTGATAGATIQDTGQSKPRPIHLKGNAVTLPVSDEELNTQTGPGNLVKQLVDRLRQIVNGEKD